MSANTGAARNCQSRGAHDRADQNAFHAFLNALVTAALDRNGHSTANVF
jgi:hypothetical protein